MKIYRLIISIEVEADDEDAAFKEARNEISDPTMIIEAITEIAPESACFHAWHHDVCVGCGEERGENR
jgi:hypothetical protein